MKYTDVLLSELNTCKVQSFLDTQITTLHGLTELKSYTLTKAKHLISFSAR